MAIPQTYKRHYNAIVTKYVPLCYNAIQEQIKFFVEQYKQGLVNYDLPRRDVALTLFDLHRDAAKPMAVSSYRQVTRRARKSTMTADEIIDFMIAEYFRTQSVSKIDDITNTTIKQIQEILQKGNEQGWGISKITSELLNSVKTRQRAMLIASTEATTGANIGAMTGAAATGIATQKEWISARDNRTRRIPRDEYDHFNMDGVRVGYSELFDVQGIRANDRMEFPGDPKATAGNRCNCRCTVAFVPIRDGAGSPIPIEMYARDNSSLFVSLFQRAKSEQLLRQLITQIIQEIGAL